MASAGELSAPSHQYAPAQSEASIPCSAARSSPTTLITPMVNRNAWRHLRRWWCSIRIRILASTKAIHITPVPWIAIVKAMSDRPQIQFSMRDLPQDGSEQLGTT